MGSCGCCGNPVGFVRDQFDREWCKNCEGHVLSYGQMYDRTYFAQFNRECPYEVNRGVIQQLDKEFAE